MVTRAYRGALLLGVLAVATSGFAQTPVYRYTEPDGRVVYSDRPPPSSARNVQTKRLGANFIDTSEPNLAAQQASERFPVTLFTFECGEVCQNAEALLNKRGVPYATVNVQNDEQGRARLQAMTGDDKAPVLAVGDGIVIKGYNESRWQASLDQAGYPKTPAPRRGPTGGRVTDTAPTPPPAVDSTRAVTAPQRGGDYPK